MLVNELFRLGMKRELPEILDPLPGPVLNLGAGYSLMPGADNLDEPAWNGDRDPLPYADSSVGGIYAFHFLEHLVEPRLVLQECQRVLAKGAPLTIVVPHAMGTLAYQDLDHKKFFVLETWKTLIKNDLYAVKHASQWRIQFNAIVGITEANLAILTQLVKE